MVGCGVEDVTSWIINVDGYGTRKTLQIVRMSKTWKYKPRLESDSQRYIIISKSDFDRGGGTEPGAKF